MATDDEITAIMGRLAAGDSTALSGLLDRCHGPVSSTVRHIAAQRGHQFTASEIDGVVLDVCLDIVRRAGSWSPDGGALPWVWAQHRVANTVDAAIGQSASRLPAGYDREDEWSRPSGGCGGLWPACVLLAERDWRARLLVDAFDAAAVSVRDREIWVEYTCERSEGNPAASATVARLCGVSEVVVRQVARRVRGRLLRLADGNDFAVLGSFPPLAA